MQISRFRWFGTETHIFPDLKKHLHPHGRRWTVWTSEMPLIVNFVHPCPSGPFKNVSLVICGQDDRTWLVMR